MPATGKSLELAHGSWPIDAADVCCGANSARHAFRNPAELTAAGVFSGVTFSHLLSLSWSSS
jgi:hypothetical protein